MEELIGISKVESGGLSTVTVKDFKTQYYFKESMQPEEETTIKLSEYPGIILVFDGNSSWGCDALLKSSDGLTVIKSTRFSLIAIDSSLQTSEKVNLHLQSASTLKIKNKRSKTAVVFLRFIPII